MIKDTGKFGISAIFRFVQAIALLACSAHAQQPLLQITSPAAGAFVAEGQTLTITVSANPTVQNIFVMTQSPLPEVQPTSSATQFTLTLPTNLTPGVYQIGAIGSNSSGDVESAPVLIDVERQDAPVSITVSPTTAKLFGVGSQQPLQIFGTYADGTNLFLSNSTLTQLVSSNTPVATVTGATPSSPNIATIIAVGTGQSTTGQSTITVSTYAYGATTPSASATVTATVVLPPPGPAPMITSVTPTTGVPGVTQVTVNGSNFGDGEYQGYVELGSLSATTITSWTPNQIVATVPAGSMSGVVEVKQNGIASNDIPFTTVTPTITGVSPTSGSTGALVTISGSNFGASQGTNSMVLFNHTEATPRSWSASSIVAPVPAGATTGNILVNVNGTPSNAVSFTTTPAITSVQPTTAEANEPITINGSNFGYQDANTVALNGTSVIPNSWGASAITLNVPSGIANGSVATVVTVNGFPSNSFNFTVTSPAPPANLTATAASSTQVNLSWTPSTAGGLQYYVISRGTSSGSLTPLVNTGPTTTSYLDTTASPTTTYYYVVQAVDAYTASAPSNEASATTYATTPPYCPTQASTIAANFNGTAIGSGDYLWFTSVLKPSGLGSNPVTIFVRNSAITFTANGTNYSVPVPDANIVFSPSTTTATTSFNASSDLWQTTVPSSGLAGNTVLDPTEFLPSGGLPGGIKNVTWTAGFATDTSGVTLNWQWSAAVYTSFSNNYSSLGVKPVDDNKASQYQNSDHAGTPESYKSYVTGGAMGGGGSNYTGSNSGTASVTPNVVSGCQSSGGGGTGSS